MAQYSTAATDAQRSYIRSLVSEYRYDAMPALNAGTAIGRAITVDPLRHIVPSVLLDRLPEPLDKRDASEQIDALKSRAISRYYAANTQRFVGAVAVFAALSDRYDDDLSSLPKLTIDSPIATIGEGREIWDAYMARVLTEARVEQ